ncbi:SusC/RagA family TonB-linked outer membrane protein [Chitinophaga barathri]|uniref:TonB-dependent receptor n=1 Tax=Chitinophaga barathri TaxID=1647451 RepID=A0A3N4MHF7_9BACT|nr:TonB-dependent receptor [Chitinophaga barathri]RPD43028.1 TonB-dependent receptor [Chitinophaga barathri]
MKLGCLTIAGVLFSIQLLTASPGSAQGVNDVKVTVALKKQPLLSALRQIEEQTSYRFAYVESQVNVYDKLVLSRAERSVGYTLALLLYQTDLRYTVRNNTILLLKREQDGGKSSQGLPESHAISEVAALTVKGSVKGEHGETLPGVSILEKGTKNGTISNEQGGFSINVASGSAVLVFSIVGYSMQEVPVDNRQALQVTLAASNTRMGEVVVVGYGAQNKRNVTGAISKVDMKQMENLPTTNVSQALRGRIAGVQFVDNGRPGQGGSILIRGTKSLNGGNNPLIIVDGIQFNSSLADINPNDIESMEVLKDASAAAIYGSRAANGVILITSKKGKSEKPVIRANVFQGFSGWSYKLKTLSPERYIQALLDWRKQSGLESDPAQIEKYLQSSEAENYQAGHTVDPWEEIAQQGRVATYDLNVSGRSKATNYFLSASYTDEKGLIYNDNQKRISLRANIENKITSWLTLGLHSTYIKRDLSGKEAAVHYAYHTSPYGRLYYDDGDPTRFPVPEEQLVLNPMRAALLTENEEAYHNLFTNFYALLNLPGVPGLSYRFNYSPNYRWRHNYNFFAQDKKMNSNTTSASKFNQENFDWVFENILTYKKRINENHAFDVTLLYGQTHTQLENTTANASPLANPALKWNSLTLGEVQTVTSDAEQTDGVSSMARLNYELLSRYIFTFTARRDGSSVFAENNKYATFPSAAFAWILSDEQFFKPVTFVNSLKLRASYGSVGNQAIGPYQSLSLSASNQYVYGDGGSTSTGVYPVSIANPDLKWETTATANLALDAEFFDGRLAATIEGYNIKTKNLIVRRSIPIMTGYTSILTNLGETNNRGIEITINSANIQRKNFEWNTNAVFSTNKNKLVHLYNSDIDGDGKEDNDVANKWFIGEPVFVAYDYEQDGIYQEGDVLPTGYKPGFVRLRDVNGDKTINTADRKVIGQLEPKYRWGITNNFRYKDFSLSIFVNAMQGWIKSFNQLDFTGSSLGNNYPGRAVNMLDAGWWTEENKSTTRPSLVYTNPFLHGYYMSRDFIRLQDVSLSYEVPKKTLERFGVNSLRIYVSGRNLYTLTDWIGPDPESGYSTQGEYFPTPRSVAAGLNVSF